LVSGVVIPFFIGGWQWRASLGILLASWIVVTVAQNIWGRVRIGSGELNLFERIKAPSRGFYGMHLAHLGVAAFVAGITVVTSYQTEKDVRMNIGEVVNAGGYEFRLENLAQVRGPNYDAVRADIQVTKNGAFVTMLNPEKREFAAAQNVTSETAIDRSIFRDLYVSLGDQAGGGGWTVRVYHKPLVNWIWLGALLMAIGGGIAVTDKRYALQAEKQRESKKTTGPAKVAAATTGAE
jgi:cytochrome c-type biogenesis protein CcmF